MAERYALAAHEGVCNVPSGDGAAHGDVAAGDSLGDRHYVGCDAPVLAAEHLARPSEPGDHLICDEQYAVPVAHLTEQRPVIVGRNHRTHGAGNGLGNHAGHRLWPLELDNVLDGLDGPLAALLRRLAAELAAVEIGLRRVVSAWHQRFVIDAGIEMVAAQGHCPGSGAVVGIPAADELDSTGFAHPLEIGAAQLDGRLHRLGAAAGEERSRQVAGGDLGNLLRQANGRLGGGAQGHVRQLEHLLVGGVGDLLAAVSDVFEPQARHCVNVGIALYIGDPDSLARLEDGGLTLFGHVAGFPQVDPQVLKGGILEFLKIGGAGHAASRGCMDA